MFDTETGGLDAEVHSVFSVGALIGDLDTGEILDMFEAYHRLPSVDDYVYTDKAVEIHGITPQEAFEQGLSTEEIQEKFSDLWFNGGAAIMGGHNVDYDYRMMSRQIYNVTTGEFEANFTYRKLDSLPVMRLFTGHDNVKSGASLGQAVKALSIDMTDFGKNKYHAALFDSIACFRVLHRFRRVFDNPEFAEALTNG
ncbi:MAG: 3'-5' exonuclease [Hydrogenophaga sp.]|uniref:3'-5' exonuclease n=1 Tax=Hydrogenophaga sp. TaxID=1904254 RepID=UPI0026022D58|nr:3'-5' exonuclease [Hydrogenophaga sp.]MCV0439824.1 3'-5' exonuclease [Hydrogenophaga sp.]